MKEIKKRIKAGTYLTGGKISKVAQRLARLFAARSLAEALDKSERNPEAGKQPRKN